VLLAVAPVSPAIVLVGAVYLIGFQLIGGFVAHVLRNAPDVDPQPRSRVPSSANAVGVIAGLVRYARSAARARVTASPVSAAPIRVAPGRRGDAARR
jgi:hypothetical protein